MSRPLSVVEGAPAPAPAPHHLAERRARGAELAAEQARAHAARAEREVTELAEGVAALAQQLEAAHREQATLRAELAERERMIRRIEQRLHSERARRDELEAELDELDRELDRERRRTALLEEELEALGRRADEADHAVAVAAAQSREGRERRAPLVIVGTRQPLPLNRRAEVDVERLSSALARLRAGTPYGCERAADASTAGNLRLALRRLAWWRA